MNALDPIRHAYGEAEGPPPTPGEPGHAEYLLLRSTREVLDALPRERPDASVLDAVKASAAARARQPLLAAYGEAEPPAADAARHAEYALLRSTRGVLDRMPKERPDAEVLDAITAAARGASALGPLLHAYDEVEGEPPADDPRHAEYVLLRSTREVLDRMPKARPDPAVLGSVVAAAAARAHGPLLAAYGEAEPPSRDDPRYAEYALLRSTRDVLDRMPEARPDAAVLAAITTAAAGAVAGAPAPARPEPMRPAAPAGPRPAADRPARDRVRPSRRLPLWIGTAAMLVIVATAGIWVMNEQPPEIASRELALAPEADVQAGVGGAAEAAPPAAAPQSEEALVAQADPSAAALSPEASPPPTSPRAAPPPAAPASAVPAPRAVPPPPGADFAQPDPARLRPAGDERTGRVADEAAALVAAPPAAATPVATWEAADDVRRLSLRLQEMAETSEGLSWGAPPVPFGATTAAPGERLEGVQQVGDGFGPAHIEVRMRTTRTDRSDGQQPHQ